MGVNRRRLVAAILAAVLVVAIVASVAVAVGGGDDDSSDGGGASDPATGAEVQSSLSATIVRDPGEVLPITAAPAEYHVIYRVESAGATEVQVRTEEVSVRRPFDAEVVAYSGDGSTGTVDVVVRSNLGLYADLTDPDAPDIGEGIPAAALGDLRFDGTLGDLVAANLFVPRERRTLLGRECQVYRTGRVVESLAVAAPTDHTYADVCIDAAGIVLEQVAFVDGRAIHYEVATSVEDAPQFAAERFRIDGEPLGLEQGGVELVPLALDGPPTSRYWVPSAASDEMALGEHVARYLLRLAADPAGGHEEETETTLGPQFGDGATETFVDVYVAGAGFVVVQQGALGAQPSRDVSVGTDVDAGALGPARVVYGVTGHTLVATTDTWFVEINAPRSATDLAALAASFEPVARDGG